MTFQAPETDPEQERRVQAALVNGDRVLCDRLLAAAKPASYEAALLRRAPATFDAIDRALLQRLAWHYRRRLPAYLRPRVNPDDPIVRERDL